MRNVRCCSRSRTCSGIVTPPSLASLRCAQCHARRRTDHNRCVLCVGVGSYSRCVVCGRALAQTSASGETLVLKRLRYMPTMDSIDLPIPQRFREHFESVNAEVVALRRLTAARDYHAADPSHVRVPGVVNSAAALLRH